MMNTAAFLTLREDTLRALRECRLRDALLSLTGQLSYVNDWECKERLAAITEDYDRLLDYMERAADDPQRKTQHARLLRETYKLAESVHRVYRHDTLCSLVKSEAHESERAACYRELQGLSPVPNVSSVLTAETEPDLLFDTLRTAPFWSEDEWERATAFLADGNVDMERKALAVTAVTFNLLYAFDDRQFLWLCRAALADLQSTVAVRAFTGAALVGVRHKEWFALFPQTRAALRDLVSAAKWQEAWIQLQYALLVAPEAPNYAKRLATEIEPILRAYDGKTPLQAIESGEFPNDATGQPNSGRKFIEAIGAIAQAQSAGVDISYTAFRMVFGRLPFFNRTAHWFYVFSPTHREIAGFAGEFNPSLAEEGGRISNTARFAWIKANEQILRRMDEEERRRLATMLESQIGGPELKARIVLQNESNDKPEILAYVRDLYRYFTLYPQRDENENPFRTDLFLVTQQPFSAAYRDQDVLKGLAEYCMAGQMLNHADELFAMVRPDVKTLQEQARARYHLKNYTGAIEVLDHALLLDEDNFDTHYMLADIYRHIHNFEEALVHLIRLEEMKPDDYKLVYKTAHTFMRVGLYDEALARLYKIDYNQPGLSHVRHTMGWVLLCMGRHEEAKKVLDERLKSDPIDQDYFNAGHNEWKLGNIEAAVRHYIEFLKSIGATYAKPDFFEPDKTELHALGLTDTDLSLMRDLINKHLL